MNTNTVTLDHGNMGMEALLVVLAYTVMQILTKIGFSVMAVLNKGFRVQSHTPDQAATHFYDEGDRPHQKMRFIIVALFT